MSFGLSTPGPRLPVCCQLCHQPEDLHPRIRTNFNDGTEDLVMCPYQNTYRWVAVEIVKGDG